MSQSFEFDPMAFLRILQQTGGGQQGLPFGGTALPTTSEAQTGAETIPTVLTQTPASSEREQTAWEKWGTSDRGLAMSAILGNLAQAVDPQGMGGRAGGAMSKMAQGEMAARNLATRVSEQQKANRELLALYKALLGGQTGATPAIR